MTLNQLHEEIERVSERRTELWNDLSHGHDPEVVREIRQIDARLAQLWDDVRTLKAALRFGNRDKIVARARVEERLERAA
jgi:ABC-type phosphate transport system auxiliary subunit